jgi:hypothetical protein
MSSESQRGVSVVQPATGGSPHATTPSEYPWLLSAYDAEEWITSDTRPEGAGRGTDKIRWNVLLPDGSHLTDPQHAHLVATARRATAASRTGPYATLEAPESQRRLANEIVTLISWMVMNAIYRFEHLTPADFDDFVDALPLGNAGLLRSAERVRSVVERIEGGQLHAPTKPRHINGVMLDRKALLHMAGVDSAACAPGVAWEMDRLADHLGLYLYPKERARLDAGRPEEITAVSSDSIRAPLRAWAFLWKVRHLLPDPLSFDPFARRSLDDIAAALGRPGGRTASIPAPHALFLIDRSIRWIMHYGPDLVSVRQSLDAIWGTHDKIRIHHSEPSAGRDERRQAATSLVEAEDVPLYDQYRQFLETFEPTVVTDLPQGERVGSPWPLVPNFAATGLGVTVNCALTRFLPAACMIVIGAFAARRYSEITSLRAPEEVGEGLVTGEHGRRFLTTWILKTFQWWDQVPVPEIVVHAADTLVQLSARARRHSGTADVFQFPSWTTDEVFGVRARESMTWFSEFLYEDAGVENRWDIAPHQLRRFFAIMYFWHHEFPKLEALSWMLRHFNIEMTRVYVTGAERGAIFEEVRTEHMHTILTEFTVGRRPAGGGFANRFKAEMDAMLEDARQNLTVVLPGRATGEVSRIQERTGQTLASTRWGYNTPSAPIATASLLGTNVSAVPVVESRPESPPVQEAVVEQDAYGNVAIVNRYERRVERAVREYIQAENLYFHPLPSGYCAYARSGNLTDAVCRPGATQEELRTEIASGGVLPAPDVVPEACAACPHHLTGPQFDAYWQGLISKLERVEEAPAATAIQRASAVQRLSVIREYATSHVFTPEVG